MPFSREKLRLHNEEDLSILGDPKKPLIGKWVEDILALMEKVLGSSPVVIVASSSGSWMSTYVASIRPESVLGLVLIGMIALQKKSHFSCLTLG